MPNNSFTDVLRRWRALDERLSTGGLTVSSFAREWKVSVKTIRRDLDAFREIGQQIGKRLEREMNEWWYHYKVDVEPLFADTLRERLERTISRPLSEVDFSELRNLFWVLKKKGWTMLELIQALNTDR